MSIVYARGDAEQGFMGGIWGFGGVEGRGDAEVYGGERCCMAVYGGLWMVVYGGVRQSTAVYVKHGGVCVFVCLHFRRRQCTSVYVRVRVCACVLR